MIYFIVNITARTGKSRAIWMEMKEILENRRIQGFSDQIRRSCHQSGTEDFFSSRGQDLSDHRGR